MKNLIYLLPVIAMMVVGAVVQAQQPKQPPRIGYIQAPPLSVVAARTNAFRQGLHDLGYIEGKNVIIEWGLRTEKSIASQLSSPS